MRCASRTIFTKLAIGKAGYFSGIYKLNKTQDIIEKIWRESGAWPEYVQAMRLALTSQQDNEKISTWMALPGICCQAAGGDPDLAELVAAAWLLFYRAADIMDSVEDRDQPADWWSEAGPGTAISAATGLYFSACLALNRLERVLENTRSASAIREEMLRKFLEMCSGQHFDINQPDPTLESYWQIARAKSGAFFGMACWAGARLATEETDRLQGLLEFGLNLGLLIQMLDDLMEFRDLGTGFSGKTDLGRSLPVAYVREVGSQPVVEQLDHLLADLPRQPDVAVQIVEMIEKNGGVIYLLAELDLKRNLALQALERAQAVQPARQHLNHLLDMLHT